LDGTSLVGSLQEPARATKPEVTTFDFGNYSVGDARWRLIRYQDGSEELYDHEADPHEWRNLAGETRHDDIRRRLATHLPSSAAASQGTANKKGE